MIVNSKVPRYSNLAIELHRNYLFKFKLVLFSVRSNTHMVAPLSERTTNLSRSNSSSSFNPLWTMITTMFQEKSNTYHISEPIITIFFSKTCATSFTFEQFHWFIQACNETLQHFARFWRLFRSVMGSILVPFISFISFLMFCLSFFTFLIVVKFLIKQLFYSGLLDIKWLSIIRYPARPRRIIVK